MNCTGDELRMVLENGISVEVFPIPEDTNAATVAGLIRTSTYIPWSHNCQHGVGTAAR